MSCSSSTEPLNVEEASKTARRPVWRIVAQRGFAELLGTLFVGVIALHARTFSSNPASGTISPFQAGFAYFATLFASFMLFGQFWAGFTTPGLLLSFWGFWNRLPIAKTYSAGNRRAWIPNLWLLFFFQPAGAAIAAAIGWGIFNNSAFNLSLASPSPSINDGVVFLLETLGTALVALVQLHTLQHSSTWSWIAVSITYGALVAVLNPITGGVLNPWFTLFAPWFDGADLSPTGNTLVQLAYFGAAVAGPIIAVIVAYLFYASPFRSKKN